MSLLLLLRQRSGSVAYTLACAPGAYTLAGKASTLARGVGLQCQTGAYSLIGRAAELVYTPRSAKIDYNLACGSGAYALQGGAATLAVKRVVDGKSGYWRDYFYRLQAEALAAKLSKDSPKATGDLDSTSAIKVVYAKPPVTTKATVQATLMQAKPTALAAVLRHAQPTASFDHVAFFASLNALQAIPIVCEVAVSAANIYDDEEDSAVLLLLAA